jgi:pimeloyl-ACP methyl ester carboxylesterase
MLLVKNSAVIQALFVERRHDSVRFGIRRKREYAQEMSAQKPPFDPNALADWLVEGLKETVSYRLKQTFDREKWLEYFRSKIPTRNAAVHYGLKQVFERLGFKFEELKQGDAKFFLVKKKFRDVKAGQEVRRLVIIPGFGDSPASWLPVFSFSLRDLEKRFDEIIVLDFPGYMGFLSNHAMVPSMEILLNVSKMVCTQYPPTVLMGHSLGGWLAGKVAQSLPKSMEQLILIAPSGLIPTPEERERFGKFILSNKDLAVQELLSRIMYAPKKYHEVLSNEVKAFFAKEEVEQFVESVTDAHFIDQTKPFSARKLTVIWGEKDQFVPSAGIRDWVEFYGTYLDAYILKDTGHIPQLERPWATCDVIFHALLGKPSQEGKYWRKIQTRRLEWTNMKLDTVSSQTKLIS